MTTTTTNHLCGWCDDHATHAVTIKGWTDWTCTAHLAAWFAITQGATIVHLPCNEASGTYHCERPKGHAGQHAGRTFYLDPKAHVHQWGADR